MKKRLVGLDIECYDPLLRTAGYSWKYHQGYILNTALYFEDEDRVEVIAGINNENCPYELLKRQTDNLKIENLLRDPNVSIVGANLQYDIGWLLYEYGMSTYDVKCSFIDVLQAEAILDEFGMHSLETVSWKYLKYGKRKAAIEDWVIQNVKGAKGDFRKYLKEAPWDLLLDYVSGDAENPVKIWHKQLTLLKAQDLCRRCKIEFDCLMPVLQITINGYPVDSEAKEKNCKTLERYRDMLSEQFKKEYGLSSFNVNSSRDIAAFCDTRKIPYKCKITLKGSNGTPFQDYRDTDAACAKAKQLISSFRFVKSIPVAYVPSEMTERSCDLLTEEGFMFTCSPNIDKKFFASAREQFPEIGIIADWKLCNGILSKILGEKYDRFIVKGNDGIDRVHGQFKITDTVSFRLSSNSPNMQQIPSKGGFTVKEGDKEIEVKFPDLTRALFKAEPGKVLWKIDYGQIEYRLICNIAVGEGSKEVREQFQQNPHLDFHQYVVDLTGLSRKYAKNMSFGVSFGMGLPSMAESFGWTMERAQEISEQYHNRMPFVAPTLALVGDVAKQRGFIRTVCGSHARLPNPNKSYTMLNRYTQGSGAEILKSSIIRAYKEGVWKSIHPFNTVHDELNGSVDVTKEKILDVYRMAEIMTTTVELKVPLEASPEFGADWAHTKTVPEWLELREKESEKWEKTNDYVKKAVETAEQLYKEGLIKEL